MNRDSETLSIDDEDEWKFYKGLIHYHKQSHLPVPVYSYLKPTNATRFLLHLELSLGHFSTEYDLILHRTIRESLRYCKLIGANNDEDSLKLYSRELLRKYIEKQLVYFPNSTRVTDTWIVAAKELLDSVIICDEIPITDMPPILQSDLDNNKNELVIKTLKDLKYHMVK